LPQGLINPKAMARLALGEALTNLCLARVTALRDVKASGALRAVVHALLTRVIAAGCFDCFNFDTG
jgi:hypothetical protein